MGNPYEDYDAIDPFDEDSEEFERPYPRDEGNFEYEEGNFEYVAEDFAPSDMGFGADEGRGADGWGGARAAAAEPPVARDSFPKTMVRKRPAQGQQAQAARPVGRPVRGRAQRRVRQGRAGGYADSDPLASRYLDYDGQPVQPVEHPVAPQAPAQVPAPRARRPRRHRRHGCLVTLLVTAVLVVGAYWAVAHPIDDRLAFSAQEQSTVNGSLSWSVPGMPYYVLALGSDAQEGTYGERSDTMILVRVDLIGGKLTMLSIPRDTKVELEGYGTQKINAAYAFGGAGGAVRAVSELTGVSINHVAVVHLDELAGLVDYLGGVTVNVPEAAYDPEHTGINIDAGVQTLDGATAVAWARTRYGYARGDFQRQEDQRILMEAIMNRLLSLSPRELPGALKYVGDLVGTDLRCYDLVPLLLRFKLANPTVYSTSVPSTTDTIDGVSYVIADEAALEQLMRTIDAGGDPGTPSN